MSDSQTLAQQLKIKIPKQIDPKKTCLVVESQQDLRLIMVHHLQKQQFSNIIQADNGLAAMEKIKECAENKNLPSFIVSSWEMPHMNGIDLLDELTSSPDLPRPSFILTIENITKEKVMFAVEKGVDEILSKPFTLGDIIPKIRNGFKKFNHPSNPEIVYEMAKKLLASNKLDQASLLFQKLYQLNKQAARPLVGMAKAAFLKNETVKALKYLELAEKNNPSFVQVFSMRGLFQAKTGQLEDAINSYNKAIELSPLNPIRYIEAADILLESKRYQEIIDLLKIARDNQLMFPQLFHYLSQAYFNLKDYPKAVKYIKMAINKDEENLDYLNQYAISLKSTNEVEEAIRTYNKMIKIDPGNIKALFNKAILFKDSGRIPEAIKTLERLVEKEPDFEKGKAKLEELRSMAKSA